MLEISKPLNSVPILSKILKNNLYPNLPKYSNILYYWKIKKL